LTVRPSFAERPDIAVVSANVWRLADLGAKHALLLAGVGWGNMPEPIVRDDLATGRLVRLDVPEGREGHHALYAMYRVDQPPGPAGYWLIRRFAEQVAETPRGHG
jgi:DNA-binding transcriptional LysR family regulator